MGRHPVRLVKAGVFPDRGVDHVVFRAVCRPLLRGEKHAGIEGPAVDEEVEVGLLQLLIRQGQQAVHRLGAGAGIFVVPDIQAQAQGGAQHHGQQQGQQLTVDRLHRRHLLQENQSSGEDCCPFRQKRLGQFFRLLRCRSLLREFGLRAVRKGGRLPSGLLRRVRRLCGHGTGLRLRGNGGPGFFLCCDWFLRLGGGECIRHGFRLRLLGQHL